MHSHNHALDYGVRSANKYGVGDATQTVSMTAGAASTAISTPAIAAGLGLSTATAAWVAGPIIGGIAMGVIMWLNRKGPKQKVASTQIVNEAEPLLAQNRDMFLAGEKSNEAKEYALAVFNQVWAAVVASCSDSSLGNPGKACISDRQRGGKWDWFSYYYDPIANTETKPSSTVQAQSIASSVDGLFAPALGSNWEQLLGGGLVLLGIASFFMTGKKG